jgi:hypothetical protein
MATIAVFGVVAGGSAFAVSKIGTPDTANKAITAKKLGRGAVATPKLRSRAVTGGKLADGAVGTRNLSQAAPLAMAGVVVYNNSVFGWFNRLNDQKPTLTRTQPGVYDLQIPGLVTNFHAQFTYDELLSSVNLASGEQAGEISTAWTDDSAGEGLHPIIYTFDSSGTPADRAFVYLVYRAEHGVLG